MSDILKVNINEYLPLRDVVFNTLRQAILKGELLPGERLMEIQLAQRLGVSRTPIREAIRKLELEGLVTMVPRKGAEVAKITEKSLRDVLEVRKALEELAMQIACDKVTDSEIKDLEIALEEFKKAINSKELTSIAEADVNFHDVIYNATNNEKLILILNNLREQMYRYRIEYIKDYSSHGRLIKEHETMIECLKNHDKEKATIAIYNHIDNQEMAVVNSIKENE
ncbi:GntR family transcriptional regulator [Lachnotalea glycerini]|jgi:DNA-binding GntR family transcriptional regulator|uniref:GntR family transcriptional regulator n=1 Tax=Lachnotalea glycerini TaxID=1763509 RepID=A0A255IFR8_9FIRM|nr:GntR family transcriptional regulator [Lachnotalea glycerini]PXV90260.1 GntR family transcriptional regulator [Lachnotalea glycerini]RDY31014.1 GntR family transcriptional regulator [Lachnotalea glycerini]